MRLVLQSFAVATFLLVASTLNAATFYVSTSGNDANTGSISSPFRTINKAAGVVKPGDEVLVRGGVYTGLVSIGSKGTASARISFRSYPGELAVIDGTGTAAGKDLVTLYRAEYVDFSGFEVRNATKIGVCGYASNNIRMTNNTVHSSVRNGIYFGYSAMGSSYDILIDGNHVYNNVLENQYQTMTGGGWAATVVVSRTDRSQITNNRVYANHGEGIDVLMSDNALVQKNVVYDNFSVGIYIDNGRYVTIDQNLIYSSGDNRFFRGGHPAAGIQMANETYSTQNLITNVNITNNVVVNTKWGFYYGNYETGGGLKNTRVANNSFYKATLSILDVNSDTHSNSVIENNVFYQVGGTAAKSAGSGVTYRNNNWYGNNAGTAAGSGDIYGDPKFVKAGGYTAEDYRIVSGSAASGKGADTLAIVKKDYFGTTRALPVDIGAHQLGTTTIVADTQAPTVPGNLRGVSGTSAISLTWNASTDNVAVAGYSVHRNGSVVANVTSTSWNDSNVAAGTSYRYHVVAFDAAGNRSSSSNIVDLALTASSVDTQAPTTPANLRVTGVTSSSASLAWNASSDNVGVVGYRIYRGGSAIATTSSLSWTDSGLNGGTRYSYYVTALDAAGNESANSQTVSATTTKVTGSAKKRSS
ncbi:MAG TPA: right-handed parallel beta-helix repeat-containing protein [Thermoanaerobaculia bacterium]